MGDDMMTLSEKDVLRLEGLATELATLKAAVRVAERYHHPVPDLIRLLNELQTERRQLLTQAVSESSHG